MRVLFSLKLIEVDGEFYNVTCYSTADTASILMVEFEMACSETDGVVLVEHFVGWGAVECVSLWCMWESGLSVDLGELCPCERSGSRSAIDPRREARPEQLHNSHRLSIFISRASPHHLTPLHHSHRVYLGSL